MIPIKRREELEVSAGGRIRNALGAQTIDRQIDLKGSGGRRADP